MTGTNYTITMANYSFVYRWWNLLHNESWYKTYNTSTLLLKFPK